jgi:hypothetical protein
MKRLSLSLICALALLSNACEQHKASELEEEPHHDAAKAERHEGTTAEHPQKEKHEEQKTEETKPGEAPRFFPEKK